MVTSLKQIRSEKHDEIGALIYRDANLLVERWARRAVEEHPSAPRVHHEALLDHLPDFLVKLGHTLAAEGVNGNGAHTPPARRHGDQRWESGWSLPEVVADFQILRLVIVEH